MTAMNLQRRAATALGCAVAALTLLAPAAFAAPGPEYVLVNANADGDTPIIGGMARVHRCDENARIIPVGEPLRQSDGSLGERTYRTGVTLLEFTRLPSCFVVSVTGGRAGGGELEGSFVGEGRNEAGRIANVPVTPISTLVQAQPGLSERRAFERVQRLLDIPPYYDEHDLQSDDSVFDGDRYLAAAERAGGVGALTRELLADPTPADFHERDAEDGGDGARSAQAGVLAEWWKTGDLTTAATNGLRDFGASFLWDNVASGSKWVLGRFLDAYGLREVKDFLLPKSDTAKLVEMVEHLNVRINALEANGNKLLREIAVLKTQVAASPAVQLLTHIDTNQSTMAGLAKLDPAKPGLKGGTRALLEAIAVDLPNRNLLNSVLVGRGGPGLLVQDSQRAATKPFFTPADSKETRDLYDYYVLYQLRFANLLTEYWNTLSCSQPPGSTADPATCLAPETIKGMLDEFQTNIQAQRNLLKPAVPAGRFVDVKKNLMWDSTPRWVSGAAYKPREFNCEHGEGVRCWVVDRSWRNPGVDLAGESDFRGLIESIPEGQNPFAFLVANAGLVSAAGPRVERDHIGDMWLGTGGKVPPVIDGRHGRADDHKPVNRVWCAFAICHQRIERVHLQSDDRPGPYVFYNRLRDQDPEAYFAHAMPRPQPVAAGTYWHR